MTTLCVAAAKGDLHRVRELVQNGADVNEANAVRNTPLHYAAGNVDAPMVDFLLSKGANVHAREQTGRTPLHYALHNVAGRESDARVVTALLLKYGARVNSADEDGYTPLHQVCRDHALELAVLLLQHGADVNSQNADGKTPLHSAAEYGQPKLTALLVQNGARVGVKTKRGLRPGATPLHLAAGSLYTASLTPSELDDQALHAAARRRRRDAVRMLLAAGADVNAQTENGFTPLHIAAMEDDDRLCDLLLTHGAKLDAKTQDGRTPCELAFLGNHLPVIELLSDPSASRSGVRAMPSISSAEGMDVQNQFNLLVAEINGRTACGVPNAKAIGKLILGLPIEDETTIYRAMANQRGLKYKGSFLQVFTCTLVCVMRDWRRHGTKDPSLRKPFVRVKPCMQDGFPGVEHIHSFGIHGPGENQPHTVVRVGDDKYLLLLHSSHSEKSL